MPRYLTEKDIADFRAELCRVATERFARFGYEGVTMRQLAEALGCSPKTPYRYFKDKADILATVRAQAFARFADTLEAAANEAEGLIDVDPELFGWSLWAATHGVVMLAQMGMLEHGPDYKAISHFHGALMLKGAATQRSKKSKGRKTK
ncbi:MAG: TetR/AcrR family transcriptional regulator [Rhodospirillales bacterium]|nr:TetR/AcrR family transcriptional regulator [Rhodospirillales bacterium]